MNGPIVIPHPNVSIRRAAMKELFRRARLAAWAEADSPPALHYGEKVGTEKLVLPDRGLFEDRPAWRGETRRLLEAIASQDTDTALFEERGDQVHALFDLPAVTFGLLQRWEEDLDSRRDDHDRFPAEASLLAEAGLIDRPVVDEIAQSLGRVLQSAAGAEPSPCSSWHGKDWAFALTFDIDSAGMYRHGALPGTVRRLAREQGFAAAARGLAEGLASAARLRPDPHHNLDAIADRLGEMGVRSTFFSQVFRAAPIDSYKLAECPPLVRAIRRLRTRGHEIGLHGSYAGPARGAEFLHRQRAALRSLIGGSATSFRAHYLRAPRPADLAEAGFDLDATAGFPRREGFRLGTAFPVQAWTDRPLPLTIAPFHAMDVTLRYHRGLDPAQAFETATALLERIRAAGGLAVLLWHPHNIEPRLWPGWQDMPFRLADWALSRGAACGTLGEFAATCGKTNPLRPGPCCRTKSA